MSSIFFGRLFRYVPSLRLLNNYLILFNGLKSGVTKYIEPTALVPTVRENKMKLISEPKKKVRLKGKKIRDQQITDA